MQRAALVIDDLPGEEVEADVLELPHAQMIQHERALRPPHCSNRLFEWMTAGMMVGISGTIGFNPHAVAAGGFYLLQNLGLTPAVLQVFFAIVGFLRVAGLYANGHWPVYGPWCRAGCALFGALIWGEMLLSLIKWSSQSDYVSLGVPVYALLTVGELISCYRAANDGRSG